MTEFNRRFIEQFPQGLQPQLLQFASFVNGLQQRAEEAPILQWPPPTEMREQFDYFVELTWQANAAKAIALCSGIVQALNDNNLLSVAVLMRAFFEQVLLMRQYWTESWLPVITKCASIGQVYPSDLQELNEKLHRSIRRSKIDWESFFHGDFDSINAENQMDDVGLLKAAKSWTAAGEKIGMLTPAALYCVLCDFAHPNFGSALLCLSNESLRFGIATQPSMGLRAFGILFPSLASLTMELQKSLNQLLEVKFTPT
jgi:hypothetical protein